MASNKKSYIQSTVGLTCPRCREGALFEDKGLFSFKYRMHKHCHHCGVDFEPEPGFYYGAMFVSYIGSGFFLMICALLAVFVLKLSLPVTLITLFAFILLVHAYLFKVSRSIWIHWFVKYDPQVPSIKP